MWLEVERHERRKDAQLAREIEVALPHELTDQQREWLVKDFVHEQFTRRGFVADVAIHAPDRQGDARNHHAHILLPTRTLTREGFGPKARDLNTKDQLAQWRAQWAHLANHHLERHGHAARIDHRTLEAQGIDREPTLHLGPQVAAMHAKGLPTDRGDQAHAIVARNQERDALRHEAAQTAEAQQAHAQEARTTERVDAPTLNQAVTGVSHAAEQGIMMASGLVGHGVSTLADAVSHFLDLCVGVPAPRKIGAPGQLSRRPRRAARVLRRATRRRATPRGHYDQISAQLKQGPQIEQAAVGALSASDLQQIKDQGDDGLRALVRQREAELQRFYSLGQGRERRRER